MSYQALLIGLDGAIQMAPVIKDTKSGGPLVLYRQPVLIGPDASLEVEFREFMHQTRVGNYEIYEEIPIWRERERR